jgi:TRAP-type C4-dicarboxylate transport system substrate-binding protein
MFRKRCNLATLVSMLGAAVAVTAFACAADATTTLKIGTLAPADSPWGKGFKKWASDIAAETNGDLQLDFQFNGQAGDEVLMVQKIRSGQLDGAAVTAIGLGQTGVTDVLIFQLPGLFTNWGKLDAARNAMKDELGKQFESKGFSVLGWGDVGAAKTMTIGYEVHRPADLQGKGVFFFAGDPVQPKIYSSIGGITPKQLTVAEILPNLASGAINCIVAPPLAAEQLQWASRITHISTQTLAFAIGAFILSSSKMNALTAGQREVLLKKSREMSDQATISIRNADAQAYARMKASKVSYDPSEADRKEWTDVFVKVAKGLRGTVFNPAVFDKIVQIAQPPIQL